MRIPSEERMHSARLGPHDISVERCRASVLEEYVVANEAVDVTKWHGVVKRLQGCEQLVCNLLRWECELAKCRHYGVVRAASWSLVRRVV